MWRASSCRCQLPLEDDLDSRCTFLFPLRLKYERICIFILKTTKTRYDIHLFYKYSPPERIRRDEGVEPVRIENLLRCSERSRPFSRYLNGRESQFQLSIYLRKNINANGEIYPTVILRNNNNGLIQIEVVQY